MTEKVRHEISVRENGCSSENVAEGYWGAIQRCLGKLKEAVFFLEEHGNLVNTERSMKDAQAYIDEANRWFNRANNQLFRTSALIREIKALRSGQAITYAKGDDPTELNWERKPESTFDEFYDNK